MGKNHFLLKLHTTKTVFFTEFFSEKKSVSEKKVLLVLEILILAKVILIFQMSNVK